MKVSSIADLPLHTGSVPPWLIKRMIKLARAIAKIIVEEYGIDEFLKRLSDAYWFQAFGNVLGFDWHSSGLTTVVTATLKEAINSENLGIVVCGGKGSKALETPNEIRQYGEQLGLSSSKIEELIKISRLVAKIDNAVLQDGYSIYHHAFILTENGRWAVIQQGLNPHERKARRYHWIDEKVSSFVEEPHSSILAYKIQEIVLNLTARKCRDVRKVITDLVKEDTRKVRRLYNEVLALLKGNKPLIVWLSPSKENKEYINWLASKLKTIKYLEMPWELNWNALKRAFEFQPKKFEEILEIRGIGPATIRGLALVANLIYGSEIDWKDPAIYSFAFGGKDGVPYPVNVKAMDEAINFLEECIKALKIDERSKLEALRRLRLSIK